MKLRVLDNSIRLRLTQAEVALARKDGLVRGRVPFAGSHLSILVEKDFACLAPREDEDETDMYPHPLAGKESC